MLKRTLFFGRGRGKVGLPCDDPRTGHDRRLQILELRIRMPITREARGDGERLLRTEITARLSGRLCGGGWWNGHARYRSRMGRRFARNDCERKEHESNVEYRWLFHDSLRIDASLFAALVANLDAEAFSAARSRSA